MNVGARTFGSLFAGIGGADLGLAGLGLTPAWQVECDPYRRAVLANGFRGVLCAHDARDLSEIGRLPWADVIYAEPPRAQRDYVDLIVAWLATAHPSAMLVNIATGGDASVYDVLYHALLAAEYVASASNVRYVTVATSPEGQAIASACRTMLVLVAARAPFSIIRLPGAVELRLAAGGYRAPSAAAGYLETALIETFSNEAVADIPTLEAVRGFPAAWTSGGSRVCSESEQRLALREATPPALSAWTATHLVSPR